MMDEFKIKHLIEQTIKRLSPKAKAVVILDYIDYLDTDPKSLADICALNYDIALSVGELTTHIPVMSEVLEDGSFMMFGDLDADFYRNDKAFKEAFGIDSKEFVDKLISGVEHDYNNPLRATSYLAEFGIDANDPVRAYGEWEMLTVPELSKRNETIKPRVFFDLDGVIYNTKPSVPNEFRESSLFFKNSALLNEDIIELMHYLSETGLADVYVLSTMSYAGIDTALQWIGNTLPFVNKQNVILCPYKANKEDFIPCPKSTDIIIDDSDIGVAYSKKVQTVGYLNGLNDENIERFKNADMPVIIGRNSKFYKGEKEALKVLEGCISNKEERETVIWR